MTTRSAGYSIDEDKLLCQIYLDISQDPITGVNQSRDRFWDRVVDEYNRGKRESWELRNKRSVQCRYQTIEKAVRKLNGCLRQVESLHPSGASEKDIIAQAKSLLIQDPNFTKGFKFDHVWEMMKDFEKFKDVDAGRKKARNQGSTYISSESEAPTPNSPLSSPNLSSFSLNLNEDVAGESTSSQRPSGVKKAKMKRKMDEGYMKMIESQNTRLEMMFKESTETKKEALRLKEFKEENKILFRDVDSIVDPNIRELLRQEQKRIVDKRSQQFSQQQPQQSSAPFTQFFNDFGASGNDLPDY